MHAQADLNSQSSALRRTGFKIRTLGVRRCAYHGVGVLGMALGLGACGTSESVPVPLLLLDLQPADGRGVYLNEELVLTFSSALDPASITSTSLRITDTEGGQAVGRWDVMGRQARFVPSPVLSANLSDGGYRPDMEYRLDVVGFPRLDGLRSVRGEPLAQCFTWAFSTAAVGPGRRGFVFDDASPGVGALVGLDDQRHIQPGEPLLLECSEPLDPSSLRESEFRIQRFGGSEESRSCGVRSRFLANHPEGSLGLLQPHAVIELMPEERLEPGKYILEAAGVTLTDYGGNPVWPSASRLRSMPFQVRRASPTGPTGAESKSIVQLSFSDREGFVSVPVPGSDGLAHWGDGGALGVRYPLAAGTGELGALALVGIEARRDVHTTALRVPSGRTLDLGPGRGLRVLRSQGRMEIAGRLDRQCEYLEGEPVGAERANHPYVKGESVGEWLARARAEGWDFTVLVAGGDLVISGELVVNTPLLLVAGGWIRVEGRIDQPPRQLWLLKEGGGLRMDPTASVPDMRFERPTRNPLTTTLHLAAVTTPVPALVSSYHWLDAEVGARRGAGSFEVSYLPAEGPIDRARAVQHPRLLEGEGQVRVLLDLYVPPGELWDPPSIDFVNLFWAPQH